MVRSSSLGLAVMTLVLIVLTAGCGEAEIIPAQSHDLGEPWQARPFAVDPALVMAAERICREPAQHMFPAGLPLVVVDARGDDRLLLLFAGPADTSECFLMRDRTGQLRWDSGGGSGSDPPPPALRPTEIRFSGAGSSDVPGKPWSYGIGQAGMAVASVELTPPSGDTVQASLNRGWFAAWWYGLDHDAGIVVRGYDAVGGLVGSSP
jgi:hypothetical protein